MRVGILLVVILTCGLMACKRKQICVCKSEYNGETMEFDFGKMRRPKAYENCKAANTFYEKSQSTFGWNCTLK